MKVYIVAEYINDYPENGGGFSSIVHVYTNEKDAKDFCQPPSLFEDYEPEKGEAYYEYYAMEVE